MSLVLTMGDPAGIGPEITLAAWRNGAAARDFAVIGDATTLKPLCQAASIPLQKITQLQEVTPDALCVLDQPLEAPAIAGEPNLSSAKPIIRWIETAVALVQSGQAQGLVTNPINKKLLVDGAGFAFPGHTEFLAHLDGGTVPVMMLSAGDFRVVPLTIHMALAQVPKALTEATIIDQARIVDRAMKQHFGIKIPRIAVAGLNPHAGEGGLMGEEEIHVITPALEKLRAEGMAIEGPMSADTMFHPPARASYDVALCMYHDQALIPVKTVGFDEGVNTTLGLTFPRTSPDHGTAYGIAGQGVASSKSLEAALNLAAQMAENTP